VTKSTRIRVLLSILLLAVLLLGVVAAPAGSHYAPDFTAALASLLLIVAASRSVSYFADPVLTRFPDSLRASVPSRAPPLAW
jgi:hypothetical protein